MKNGFSRKLFIAFNYTFLFALMITMVVPFLNLIALSLSDAAAIARGQVSLWPVDFTLINFQAVFVTPSIWRAFGVTVYITTLGTLLNLFFTALMAYSLSKPDLRGRKIVLVGIIFTMIFSVPMIPAYLLVKSLGLLNTLWALMVPGLISGFNLIIMTSFFLAMPKELLDAAKIDGCGEYRTLWRIVLPLSLPSLSTIGLFYAVSHWNTYFSSLMYLQDPKLYPLQVKLRQMLVNNDLDDLTANVSMVVQSPVGLTSATIIFATLPILFLYPFLQKHFIQGSMLGSLKG